MRKFILALALISLTAVPTLAGISSRPTNTGNHRPTAPNMPTQSQSHAQPQSQTPTSLPPVARPAPNY
jgi:hypothetical protein